MKFKFLGFQVKKFKTGGAKNLGVGYTNCSISESTNIFGQ